MTEFTLKQRTPMFRLHRDFNLDVIIADHYYFIVDMGSRMEKNNNAIGQKIGRRWGGGGGRGGR